MEANSHDLSNQRSTHGVKPSVLYNNMIKNEDEYSSKTNSRNLSKRSNVVNIASGRKDKNNSYQYIKKMPIPKSSQRKKNSCALKSTDVDKIFSNMRFVKVHFYK